MVGRSLVLVRTRWLGKILAVGLFAAFTALTARIAVWLPFTPVPVTVQVLAVLLGGLVLGARGGAAAQVTYLAAIAAGLPFTASGTGGPAAFLGPTAGYLIAFAPAAFATGWLSERLGAGSLRSLFASFVGVAIIYIGGTSWLSVWFGGDVARAWRLGAAPFVLADAAKAAVAAAVTASGRRLVSLFG